MSFLYNAIPTPTMTREDMKEYFNVAISTSMVIFAFDGEKLRILIQKRAEEPFKGAWQLPTRYVLPNEETIPMTNTIDSYSEQLNAFGKVYRNPLGRVINVGFYCIVKMTEEDRLLAEQKGMKWAAYSEIPDLAFDHNEIIDYAKERLKRRFKRRPVNSTKTNTRKCRSKDTISFSDEFFLQSECIKIPCPEMARYFFRDLIILNLTVCNYKTGSHRPPDVYFCQRGHRPS